LNPIICLGFSSQPLLSTPGKALGAIDRPVFPRLERNRAFPAAVGAYGGIHPARRHPSLIPLDFALGAALLTAARLVLEAFLGIEFLLSGRKNEFLSALLANKNLVCVHVSFSTLFLIMICGPRNINAYGSHSHFIIILSWPKVKKQKVISGRLRYDPGMAVITGN
jgi:hypothetical protein